MRRSVSGWVAAAAVAVLLTACGREEAGSDIELTDPASSAEMEKAFGPAVSAAAEADVNAAPRDPEADDLAPVDFTAEPVPVPDN
jgi:PBP1b-binding outer membrane lipoprotein LpoB